MGIYDMESLIKKTIFARSNKDSRRNIATQRTQSFKEKKRSLSWIRRQSSSRKMNWNYDSSDDDYPTAIAAAAHAIHSVEESKSTNQREAAYHPDGSLNKIKSKGEETGFRKSRVKFSDSRESFDDHEIKKGRDNPAPSMKNEIGSSDIHKTESNSNSNRPANPTMKNRTSSSDSDESETNSKKSGNSITKNVTSSSDSDSSGTYSKKSGNSTIKNRTSSFDSDESESNSQKHRNPTIEQAPPMKRPPTFADKHLYIDNSKIPETPEPKPNRGPANSMAEAWEKEELASIKERHEALKAIIENWEIKKKQKAERKLERIKDKLDKRKAKTAESYYNERKRATVENWDINKKRELDRKIGKQEEKLEKSRTKAEESHRNEIKLIEEIAKGAKAQAEENRRNEELKVREKADKIRSTGKLPPTCLCF